MVAQLSVRILTTLVRFFLSRAHSESSLSKLWTRGRRIPLSPAYLFLANFHVYCSRWIKFWLEHIGSGEPIIDDVSSKTMSQVYRIEVPGRP